MKYYRFKWVFSDWTRFHPLFHLIWSYFSKIYFMNRFSTGFQWVYLVFTCFFFIINVMLLVSIVPPMTEMGFHQISLVFFVVVVGGGRSLPAASRLVRSLWTGCSFFSFFFYRVDSFYFNGPVMSGGERPCSFFFSFFFFVDPFVFFIVPDVTFLFCVCDRTGPRVFFLPFLPIRLSENNNEKEI